jgi:hypothetical protein
MSPSTTVDFAPFSPHWAATASQPSRLWRAWITSPTPAAASRRQSAAPIPLEEPVTMIDLDRVLSAMRPFPFCMIVGSAGAR